LAAKHVLMTPFGPVEATFSWTGEPPLPHGSGAGRRRRGRHAAVEVPPATSDGPPGSLPVRGRRPYVPLRDRTPPPDRPDLDTLRRVLAALYRL